MREGRGEGGEGGGEGGSCRTHLVEFAEAEEVVLQLWLTQVLYQLILHTSSGQQHVTYNVIHNYTYI